MADSKHKSGSNGHTSQTSKIAEDKLLTDWAGSHYYLIEQGAHQSNTKGSCRKFLVRLHIKSFWSGYIQKVSGQITHKVYGVSNLSLKFTHIHSFHHFYMVWISEQIYCHIDVVISQHLFPVMLFCLWKVLIFAMLFELNSVFISFISSLSCVHHGFSNMYQCCIVIFCVSIIKHFFH